MIDYLSDDLPHLSEEENHLLRTKVDIDQKYKLPTEVKYCKKCVISNQRPRIKFDENGVCNACNYWERKKDVIDWDQRENELRSLCDKYRRNDGSHDVLVPSSGGKDSVYVAHILKTKYGMNPLTMTWAPMIYTDIGFRNLQASIHAGLDNVLYTPNGLVQRRMVRISTIEVGDPFQPFIYGQSNLPLKVACERGINLIMDGENGEAEYGGDPSAEVARGFTSEQAEKYWLSDFPVEKWLDYGFTPKELSLYQAPSKQEIIENHIERHFFSYYKNWKPQDNYYYCMENSNFACNPKGRSEGTFSKYASLDDAIDPYHYHFSLLKFGIARATSDAAHEIREDLLDRDEAITLVQRYDHEEPTLETKSLFKKYIGVTEEELNLLLNRWRNERLWEYTGNSWKLKNSISY